MATYNNVITNVSGSVGIGTTNASSRLTVLGNSSLPSEPIATFKPGGSQTGGVGVLDVQNSAGTSILFVTGSQRVGIGTLTPGAGLHVVSSLNVGSIFSSTNLTQFYLQFAYNTGTTFGYLGNGTGLVTGGGNADLALRSEAGGSILFAVGGSTERVRFDTSGNVGIGTSTYTARLFVSGSSTASTPTMIVREGVVSPTGGAGTFNVQNSAGTSLFFVSGSGNVGIGTGVPSSKFEVVGVSGSLFSVTDQLSGSLFSVNTISGLPILEVFSDNTLVAGAFNSNALVVSGSSVGVGTTSFTARLFVSGSSTGTTPSLIVRHGAANGSDLPVAQFQNSVGTTLFSISGSGFVSMVGDEFRQTARTNNFIVKHSFWNSGASYLGYLGFDGTTNFNIDNSGNGPVVIRTNNTDRLYVDFSGNVGIATTTALSDRLAVNGSASVSGSLKATQVIIGDQSLTAGTSAITGALVVRGGPPLPSFISGYGNASIHLIGTSSFGHSAGIVFGDYGADYGVGIFEAPDDSLTIRTANTLLVSSTFGMLVREGLPADTSGLNVLDVLNWNGTNVFNVSGSGFVGVGTTGNLNNNRVAVYSPTPTTTFAGQVLLSSDAASSAVDNGGQLNFQMYDNTSLRGSAYIKGAKENGTSGNYNTYLSFATRQNGVSTLTERMRIDSTGSVGIGVTNPGAPLTVNGAIRFLGNSAASYVQLASNPVADPITYTFPLTDATDANRVLTSNATGSLTWTTNDGRELYLSSSGADTYTATFTPGRTTLQTGQIATVLFGSANTTTATLNGKNIKKAGNANQQDLVAGDIPSGSFQNLVYDGTDWIMAGGSAKVQTFNIIAPLAVTAGTAYTITITTLSRVIRTITGNALTNTGTTEIALPADFLCFPPNAISIESARNNAGSTLTLSLGKNGTADGTVNAVSLMATGTGGTFETKSTTPTSAYSPGDRILLSLVATTGASASANVQISNLQIKYITR